jgi:chitinase
VIENHSETTVRQGLFNKLSDVVELSHGKATAERGNSDSSKQSWARVMIQAIGTYGNLLRDVELEQLAADVEELKKVVGVKNV